MALDRPNGGIGPGDDGPEPESRPEPAGSDIPVRSSEPVRPVLRVEWRTRAEYYDALRAADGKTPGGADAESGRDGWNGVDAADRPPAEDIRVTPERATHILDGEADGGGGHRHGTGKPGKTEFPASWDDKKILNNVLDVARYPDCTPTLQHWNNRWICIGTREDVEVSVIVLRSGKVWTSWPEEGSPGVVRNS